MRIACGFLILVLFIVFSIIIGCSREVATNPDQSAPGSHSKDGSYEPAIADITVIDSSEAWAIDRTGTTLYHAHNGASVGKQATDFGISKTLISFVDHQTAFAFADNVGLARLWRTTDAGQSWQRVNDLDQTVPGFRVTAVHQLHFADGQHGWLVDGFGVWRTQDGGARWEEVFGMADAGPVKKLLQASFSGSERVMVTTNQGIYLTVDGGKVWKLTNKNAGFRAIYSLDEHTGWAWSNSVERTDDGGNTWRQLYQLKDRIEIFSTQFINKNEGWAAGVEVEESFGSVVRNPSSNAWHGILLHTKDGGKNWDRPPMPTDLAFHRVGFSDSKHGWLVGMNRLYRTIDGGITLDHRIGCTQRPISFAM